MFEIRPVSELDFHELAPEWLTLSLILGGGILFGAVMTILIKKRRKSLSSSHARSLGRVAAIEPK